MRGVPARRYEPGRACDRTRVPGTIWQIRREHFALVRGHKHIIGGGLLGKNRDLPLDLDDAAVGPPRAAGILEHPLLDDLRTEPPRSTAQRVRQELVALVRAHHKQPSSPLLPREILR